MAKSTRDLGATGYVFPQKCSRRCQDEINHALQNNSGIRIVSKEFVDDFSTLPSNTYQKSLTRFYEYMRITGNVHCDIGMFYVEKHILGNSNVKYCLFKRIQKIVKDDNTLINNKIKLYSFIKENHLNISPLPDHTLILGFRSITDKNSITEKLNVILKTIKQAYMMIGCDKGIDKLLTVLIFITIKSKVKDLFVTLYMIKKFRRKYYGVCNKKNEHGTCTHIKGLSMYSDACECYSPTFLTNSEIEYYITVFESVLSFIKEI